MWSPHNTSDGQPIHHACQVDDEQVQRHAVARQAATLGVAGTQRRVRRSSRLPRQTSNCSMAGVRETTLNWLYSVLTSVSACLHARGRWTDKLAELRRRPPHISRRCRSPLPLPVALGAHRRLQYVARRATPHGSLCLGFAAHSG